MLDILYIVLSDISEINQTKTCSKCNENKLLSDFYQRKNGKHRADCKACFNLGRKEYRENNPELVKAQKQKEYKKNRDKYLQRDRKKYQNNKTHHNKKVAEWQRHNPEKSKAYKKKWRNNNKDKIRKQNKNRIKNNPVVRLRKIVSKSIWKGLKIAGGSKKNSSIAKFLPYTFLELKVHLESQFEEWMNWGVYPTNWDDENPDTWTWQIDHIIPHSKFNYASMEDEDFLKCWDLTNLRPLSAKENALKGNRC